MALATGGSRAYILARRGGGVGDLSGANVEDGDLDLGQAVAHGIYKVNCTHQIGIATASEVGLSAARFPLRIILTADSGSVTVPGTELVSNYWKILNHAKAPVAFARKPLQSELALKNLYKHCPDLDARLWDIWNTHIAAPNNSPAPAGLIAAGNSIYQRCLVPIPTAEQSATLATEIVNYLDGLKEEKRIAPFRIGESAYLWPEPHGEDYTDIDGLNADRMALYETALCILMNRARLRARYETLSEGVVTVAAYSIANMFRMGLFESHEHEEYYTVIMVPAQDKEMMFEVADVRAPAGIAPPADVVVGQKVDLSKMKVITKMVELGNAMVVGSGLMHYLFNHTTGGSQVSGVLLSTLSMYKLITNETTPEECTEITSLIYEALHPSNKRAVANLFFKNSGVLTHGRCANAPRYEMFNMDAFMTLRSNPYPAGSHKAFMLLTALRRVLQAGLGPFLPWADQLNTCIQLCQDTLTSGARAHIGSSYYTGEPPRAQSSSLDIYLPELAQYVHTFNKGDSLSMSPHMSQEIGRRAAMSWQNLLRDIKAKDISATSADVVREFLATSGGAYFQFDPEDQNTWATAAQTANVALQSINNIFL